MKTKITITLDKALIEKLQARAEDEQRPVSNLVNRILTKALETKEKGGK